MRLFTRVSLAAFWLAACHGKALSSGAPGADAQAGRVDAQAPAPSASVDRRAYPRVLNPTGPEGTLFYAGWGEGCHVAKTPHPEAPPDLGTTDSMPCPAPLRDRAWNRCQGGVLFASADAKKCFCASAWPKPVGTEVPCPATTP